MNYKDYEQAWLMYESRHSPWSITKFRRSDNSEFYSVNGYNFITEEHINLHFYSYKEADNEMSELPVPNGYYERQIDNRSM